MVWKLLRLFSTGRFTTDALRKSELNAAVGHETTLVSCTRQVSLLYLGNIRGVQQQKAGVDTGTMPANAQVQVRTSHAARFAH